MLFWPHINPALVQPLLASTPAWRFPSYVRAFLGRRQSASQAAAPAFVAASRFDQLLKPLLPAGYVEWRYFSVIAPAFHGIVGLALFNPFNQFRTLAESGLLCIVAGVCNAPRRAAPLAEQAAQNTLHQICWMHLFPTTSLNIGGAADSCLTASHDGCDLHIEQHTSQHSSVSLRSITGLELSLEHSGLPDTTIAPCFADDFRRIPAAHWTVYNPSPIATSSGSIDMTPHFLTSIVQEQGSSVSPALQQAAAEGYHLRWQEADGYYEHSFGINPLPLHGWDFLFVPDAARRQGLVLQTYAHSRALRYVEVLWQQDGSQRYTRFRADQLQLHWQEHAIDPAIGVTLPQKRIITAHKPGLRLEVENHIPHQIPFLRPAKLAVRHFFISEQIGFASWQLSDDSGRILAEASEQPAGGEVAHLRWSVPHT